MRRTMMLVTVLGLGLAFLAAASAQSETSGTITLEGKSIAAGVGVSWGDGVLEYRGHKYPFTIEGLSVLDLGVSNVSARGKVQNLKKVEDFNGDYVLAAAGGAVGGGAGVAAQEPERRGDGADRNGARRQALDRERRRHLQAQEEVGVRTAVGSTTSRTSV